MVKIKAVLRFILREIFRATECLLPFSLHSLSLGWLIRLLVNGAQKGRESCLQRESKTLTAKQNVSIDSAQSALL